MRASFLFLVLAALTMAPACSSDPPRPKPVPVLGDACERADERLRDLGCDEQETPDGVPFFRFCKDTMQKGVNLHPECIAQVDSCAGVGKASRGCK